MTFAAWIFDLDHCILDARSLVHDLSEEGMAVLTGEAPLCSFKEPAECGTLLARARAFDDIGAIAELPGDRFLVTRGRLEFRRALTEALELKSLFKDGGIDDVEKPRPLGIKTVVSTLAFHNALDYQTTVAVSGEHALLIAAEQLGMPTVQVLRPRVEQWPRATYHVASLSELSRLEP